MPQFNAQEEVFVLDSVLVPRIVRLHSMVDLLDVSNAAPDVTAIVAFESVTLHVFWQTTGKFVVPVMTYGPCFDRVMPLFEIDQAVRLSVEPVAEPLIENGAAFAAKPSATAASPMIFMRKCCMLAEMFLPVNIPSRQIATQRRVH